MWRGLRFALGARQDQGKAAAVDKTDRFALDGGEGPAGVAFDEADPSHVQAGRKHAAEAGGDQHVAFLDVGIEGQVAQLHPVAVAVQQSADAVAGDLDRHDGAFFGNQGDFGGQGGDTGDLSEQAVGIDHRLAGDNAGLRALVDDELARKRVARQRQDFDKAW